MNTDDVKIQPTHLGRFVVLLEDAGYSRRDDKPKRLVEKEYAVTKEDGRGWHESVVTLGAGGGPAGSYAKFYFDAAGELVGHGVRQ